MIVSTQTDVDLVANAHSAADLLRVLANARRLQVLCALRPGELSVGRIAEHVGLSQSALSQHLGRLRDLGIVATRRESQTIYYRLASDEVRRLIAVLYDIYCR